MYISCINWSSSTIELLLSIENSKSYKLVLWWIINDNDTGVYKYWIVRKKCLSSDVIQCLQNKIVNLEKMVFKQQQIVNTYGKLINKILHKDDFFYISDSSSSAASSDED